MDTKLKAALMKARSLKRDEKRRMYFLLVPKSGTEGKLVVSPRQINTTQINVAKKAAGCNRIVKGTCCGGEGNTLVFEIVTQPRRAYATLVRKLAKVEAGFMVQAEFVQAEAKEVEETSVEELTDVERRDRLIQQWVERINDDDIKEFLLQHEGQQPGKDLHKLMHEGNKLSQEGEREKVEEIIDQIDLLVKKGVQEQQQGFLDTRRGKVVAKLPAYRAKVKELRDLVTEVQKLGEAPKVEYLKVSENKQVQEIIAKRFEAQTRLSAGLPTVRKFMKEVDLARRGGPRDQVATDLGVFHQHLTKLAQDVSDTLGNLQQRLIQEEPDHGLIWMARHMKIYRHADYPVREKELLAQHAGFDKELKSLRADFGQIPLDQQPSLFAALEDRVQQAGEALLRERKALGVIEGSLRSNPLEKLMDKDKARTTPEVVFKNLERFGALFEDRADKLTGLAAEARKEQNRILERLKDLKEHFGKRLGQVAQLQGIVDKLPTNGVGLARKDLDAVRHKVAKCEHTFQDAEMLSPDFPLQSRDQLKAALLTIRALLRRVDAIEEKLPEGPDTGSGQQPDNDPGGSKQRAAEYLKARVTKVLQSLKSYHALVKQLSDERQLLQLDKMAQDEIYSDEGVAKVVQARDTAARSLPVVNRYINELRVTARYLKDNEPQAYQKAEKTLDDLFQLLDTERQHTEFNLQECDKLLTQSGGVVARILAKQARTGKALTRENLQGRIKEHQDREKSFKEEWRLLKAAESNAELQGDDLTAFGNRLKLALGLLDKEKVGLSVVAKELQDYKPGLFTSADPQQQALRNLAVYQKFLDERIVALAALQKKVGGVGQDLGSQQQFEKQIVPQFQQKTQDLDTQAAIYLNLGTERRLDDLLKLRKRLEDHLKIGQNLTKFGAYLAQPDGDPVAAGIDSLNKRLRELKDAEPTIRKQEAERLDRLDQEQPITRQLSRTNDSGMEHLVKSKEANDQAVLNEHAVLAKQIDDFLNEVRPQMKEKIARLNNAGKEKLSDDALRALMLDLARDRAFFTSKDALCSQLIERVEALQRAVTGSGVGYDKRDKNMSVAQARLQVEIIGFAKTLKSSLKDLQGIQDNMQKGLTKINALQSQNFSLQLQSSLARHGKLYTQSEIDQRIQALNDEHQSLDRQYQALLKPDVKCDRQAPRLDALKQRLTVSRDQTETQLQQLQLLINRVAQDKPTGIVLPGTKADYQAAVQRLNGFQGSLTQCKANFQALLDLVTTAHGKANGEWQKAQTALKNQLKIANDLVDRAVTLSQKPDKSLSDNTELAKLCGGMQDCMTELNRLSPLVSPDAFDDEWKNSYHYLIRSMLTSFGNIGRLFGDVETDVREHVGKLLEGGEGEVKLQAEAVDKLKPSPRTDLLTDLTHRRKAIEQTRQKLVEVEREVKAFPRLDEGQFPERLAAALKRLKELEDRLAEIETESVALARKEFQERLTPLLETARKLNTELEELRQNEERITLEGVDAIRQRVILCRQQFEGLREDQTVQKPDDLLAEIEQTWDQLVGHGKTMNGLEAVVYRRNRQQLEVDARKLLDEAKDIGRTVEREVRVDGRDMKYDRLQALHERVSVCTGALRHQRFDELFKEDPRPRQEAKETLDTAYTTISTAKKALAKIEEYNEVNRLSQSQIEERRAPVLEKVARIKRLADGINEDGSNAHHTTISRLRDRVADAQDELTQLQLSEKHRSKTRVPEALQLLDSLYTKLGTAMRNSQELQKRGQGPALSTASQIQYQWGIEYHTLFDDVWLKNNSPFPLNNVRLTVTVNEEGKAKMETLKHRRINSGERYKWTNVFSINEENVRDKRVVLSCDEDLLG